MANSSIRARTKPIKAFQNRLEEEEEEGDEFKDWVAVFLHSLVCRICMDDASPLLSAGEGCTLLFDCERALVRNSYHLWITLFNGFAFRRLLTVQPLLRCSNNSNIYKYL